MEVGNITKAATFKIFIHLSYKKHTVTFFVTVFFNIFMRQTLTNDFWGFYKHMNCVFPLNLSAVLKFAKTQNEPKQAETK